MVMTLWRGGLLFHFVGGGLGSWGQEILEGGGLDPPAHHALSRIVLQKQ